MIQQANESSAFFYFISWIDFMLERGFNMNDKQKGGWSIIFMAATFFMMVTTKYSHALGDYVLEFIGLRSWTGDYSGTHLTVIYFGILFIISLFLVRKYAVNQLRIGRISVLLIFILLMTIFTSMTGLVARNIKSNSEGLLAIGYNTDDSNMKFQSRDNKFVEFSAEFELTNYSSEKKTFHLSIDSPYYREEGVEEIEFYTLDGKLAFFEIGGNETKLFQLDLDEYNITGGRQFQNGSGGGIIQEILLFDDKGDTIRLDVQNFQGIELNR